jgi:hypothetical protein
MEADMERNTIRAALALALSACALALPAAASAEETKVLHKCVDAKGVTSIQANPCAKGTTEVWKRDAQTEPKQTPAEMAAAREREARAQAEVVQQSQELQRKLQPVVAPAPPETPVPGSHLAGATNPPEGSQLAPAKVEEPPMPQAVTVDNCQAAQAFATAVREKSWIGLTDDQMKRIFGWVADQCRVRTQTND